MLKPYGAERMKMWPVSPRLNMPGVGEQYASLLEQVSEQPSLLACLRGGPDDA